MLYWFCYQWLYAFFHYLFYDLLCAIWYVVSCCHMLFSKDKVSFQSMIQCQAEPKARRKAKKVKVKKEKTKVGFTPGMLGFSRRMGFSLFKSLILFGISMRRGSDFLFVEKNLAIQPCSTWLSMKDWSERCFLFRRHFELVSYQGYPLKCWQVSWWKSYPFQDVEPVRSRSPKAGSALFVCLIDCLGLTVPMWKQL